MKPLICLTLLCYFTCQGFEKEADATIKVKIGEIVEFQGLAYNLNEFEDEFDVFTCCGVGTILLEACFCWN